MNRVVGYIVGDIHGPKGLAEEDVLWCTDTATLFPTRADARMALKRTTAYASEHGYRWSVDSWWIKKVTL